MRGFFERGDGLIMPNNVTIYGAGRILKAAFRNESIDFYLALANCVPDPELNLQSLNEPAINTGGYQRQFVTRDSSGWPYLGQLNDEPYIESRWTVFNATDQYSAPVNRVVLLDSISNTIGDGVISVGSAWSPETLFDETTPENQRTFRYRIFLR